jgi:hypothetical protein
MKQLTEAQVNENLLDPRLGNRIKQALLLR